MRHKPSSQMIDEVFEEVKEDFDLEGLTKEQIVDFHNNMFKSYLTLLQNDEFNRVYIPKLGTFIPMEHRIEDILLKKENSLSYHPYGSEERKKLEKKIVKLEKEMNRVKHVNNNYNKK